MAGGFPSTPHARVARRKKAICGIWLLLEPPTAGATSTYQNTAHAAYHLRVIPARARDARHYLLPLVHFF